MIDVKLEEIVHLIDIRKKGSVESQGEQPKPDNEER